jgi:hypothetical protein
MTEEKIEQLQYDLDALIEKKAILEKESGHIKAQMKAVQKQIAAQQELIDTINGNTEEKDRESDS